MAGYQGLNSITDDATKGVLKALFDEINGLRTRVVALEAAALRRGSTIDLDGSRLIGGGPATRSDEIPTLAQVRMLIDDVKKATY